MPEQPGGSSEPTYEELKERNAVLEELVATQQSLIAELEARLAELERRIGRNRRNSSMPPSAEGLSNPPVQNRAERRGANRKPGKQPGAEGRHLAQVAEPDEVIVHGPGVCVGCGADLADGELVDVEIRQVFGHPTGPASGHRASPRAPEVPLWREREGGPPARGDSPWLLRAPGPRPCLLPGGLPAPAL